MTASARVDDGADRGEKCLPPALSGRARVRARDRGVLGGVAFWGCVDRVSGMSRMLSPLDLLRRPALINCQDLDSYDDRQHTRCVYLISETQ